MDKLTYLQDLKFTDYGLNDAEGFQIFTPEFIVEDMIKALGVEKVTDFSKTILEPTSGDGAFTFRILELRLKRVLQENPGLDSLRALSTIYSIEMDRELIQKQRNNIYTIMVNFAKEHGITSELYMKAVKDIILTNFYWAKTNYEEDPHKLFGTTVAYKMKKAPPNEKEPIVFYTWKFNDDFTYQKKKEVIDP